MLIMISEIWLGEGLHMCLVSTTIRKSLQKFQRNISAFNTLSYYSQAVNKVTHGRFITTVVMCLPFYLPLMSDISNRATAALCV